MTALLQPRWPVASLLLAATLASPGAAQSEAAGGAAAAEDAAKVRPDLLSVARLEAEREQAALLAQVDRLLEELRASADDSLAFVAAKVAELAAIGAPALDKLAAAMNHDDPSPSATNAGINAGRALARIPGSAALAALTRLAQEGGRSGRLNAVRALGLRGDAGARPLLEQILAEGDQAAQEECLVALGRIGGAEAAAVLEGYVAAEHAEIAVAAIRGLSDCGSDAASDKIRLRLLAELGATEPAEPVVQAALHYFARHPDARALAEIARALEAQSATAGRRIEAIAALRALGLAQPATAKEVLELLRGATRLGLRAVVREAALAMLDLGDDSGVGAVTADLDVEIERNPRNYNARYRRAEVFLEFKKWSQAANDLRDGLKIERDPRDPERVHLDLARAYAGMGRYGDAARSLAKLVATELAALPAAYPEFRPMAQDSRYARHFQSE